MFSYCKVVHLLRRKSDHHPLLIYDTCLQSRVHNSAPFRVFAVWFLHPQFEMFVLNCRGESEHLDFVPKLNRLWESLIGWNKGVFGKIFGRKQRCLARLAGAQKLPMLSSQSDYHGWRRS